MPCVVAAQTLKGVGGNVVIIEEAAYCDLQLVNEVIVPLLSMSQSVLLCISTLTDEYNYYTRFMKHTDPSGKPLFHSFSFSLVCDACRKTDFPERCTHKLHEMPRWLDSKRVGMIKSILADDTSMFLRETMGLSCDGNTRAFQETHIAAFSSRPFQRISPGDANVFVSIDPAGGGASAFAICSIICSFDRRITVCGMPHTHTPLLPCRGLLVVPRVHCTP